MADNKKFDFTKLNTLAVVSIASALTSIGAVAAIITGHVALTQIKKSGESGRGLALAGTIIGYVTIAALMAAIGAAVNELREAQILLMPVMLLLMVPMVLNMPILRHPNGTLATALSLMPPTSPMVMMLRLSSSAPPPGWQVALSILLGILGAVLAVWLAGKVFRIGLLMHGQPPDLRTLWRWVRMA